MVIPDHRTPVVTHMLWYRVGSADETPGKSGLAHFLEHLMFKGTAKNPAGRFSQVVATIGGQENAFTSSDYTGYFQRVPRDQLKTMMEFEADRMTGLVLTDEVVLPELNVVLEEHNMRVANNPAARLGEQMEAALYLNHPYGRPVIGWRHEIEKLNREDALDFYRRFYTPNNAVAGGRRRRDADEVKKLAEETYGKVPRVAEIAPRVRPQEPAPAAPRTVTLADPRVDAAEPAALLSRAVGTRPRKPGESEALEVLAHILGRGTNSRLYQTLVVDKGLAVSAGASYDGTSLDPTRFAVYGIAEARHEPAAARRPRSTPSSPRSIDKGVTADELERAKNRHDRRCDLCQRQPAHAGAVVRRRADHRLDRRPGARPGPIASAP